MANEATITLAVLLIIISAIVVIAVQFLAKGKEGVKTRKVFNIIGGSVIGLMLLATFMSSSLPTNLQFLNAPAWGKTINVLGTDVTFSQVPTGPGSSPVVDGKCVGIEDTTVTLSASDKFTSVATGGTHKYKINGNPALTVSDTGTFTASPGDKVQILWFNGSLSGAYYSDLDEVVVPCSGTKTFSKQLVANGTGTIEVFNEEGNLITTTGENETLSAGDVVTLTAKIKGAYQKGYPYGGVVIVEYNKSEIDDVIVDFGGSKVSTPASYTITFGATSSTVAYSVPAILSNQIISGSVVIDADDVNNPTDDAGDIILKFQPNNYYVNEDNGGAFEGPSIDDEKNVRTYNSEIGFTIATD